ncbi:MAG: bifunctional 5,10-methylenetetrahydrofolate dehydrogenase/5,10-methenyltetrahydrofolate cyclohydrolase [Haloarculaceae archaeon]
MPTRLEGEPVAAPVRAAVDERVRALAAEGSPPTLATVRMTDDPAAARFMELKHEACADHGIGTRATAVPPDAPADRLYGAVREASDADAVDAVFVQVPLPGHVDESRVRRLVDPAKDADCFHPANLGRLVAGDPRIEPATPRGVLRLLDAYDVDLAGADVALVGRSTAIGRPLANLLLRRSPGPDATVTVCHSRTRDLGAKTRAADVVITAAGRPGLVDGSMLAEGATVIDVSATRVAADAGSGYEVVGDVEFESASERAGAITPVPGGVGPMTMAMLLDNVVTLAERRA